MSELLMTPLVERFLKNWKTTAGGTLAVVGIILANIYIGYPTAKWASIGAACVAGLTGLLAKDN